MRIRTGGRDYGVTEEEAARFEANLCAHFDDPRVCAWVRRLTTGSHDALRRHGRAGAWRAALAALPEIRPGSVDLSGGVRAGTAHDASSAEREALTGSLRELAPWRKGPFELFGTEIDAEWRSDLKWSRVAAHIAALKGRTVLDLGCGNGYYAWRMAGAGARLVLGLDPSVLCVMQYLAVRRYLDAHEVFVLPGSDDDVDDGLACFDTVFSMGVLYHRRDPLAHLARIRRALRPGGECVLETLILADKREPVLVPRGRYAKMRNVRAIPAVPTTLEWMSAAGFENARCVDLTRTTVAEQRTTAWMASQSLADFLDPGDDSRTIEGYPAPVRGVFLASAP